MSDERNSLKGKDQAFQDRLHHEYTAIEEEYHNAYPDVKMPWLTSAFFGIFGRYGKGFVLWGLVGIAFAVILWFAYLYGAGAR